MEEKMGIIAHQGLKKKKQGLTVLLKLWRHLWVTHLHTVPHQHILLSCLLLRFQLFLYKDLMICTDQAHRGCSLQLDTKMAAPEKGIPTMITWGYGGKEVAVEGSWDNWKTRIPLQRCGKDFTIMKVLPSGVYQYRFIVDGQWRYAPDLPWAQDGTGNANNILDLLDYVPEDIESISSFEPPLSPESSYSNLPLGAEDFAKEPPLVPPHVQLPLLNLPASHMEIPPPLSRPKHVILNHLYIQKGKNGQPVVALGSTHRFRAKYVTVVLYKPVQR
ncbi:hypothetical protein V6Z12_D06G254000 [Gossypium hirsutum]